MIVRMFAVIWLALLAWSLPQQALAQPLEKRIALVIGNARYPTVPLANPENDARLIAGNLRRLGFEVAEHLNLNVRDFRRVLREFARRTQEEDGISVLYYAGHGVQIDGRNYLLPVDINLRDEEEVKDESVDIEELFVSRVERARAKARIVILDACRDNPFKVRTRNVRAAGGLAEMAARGALIAYASAPGAAAEDGKAGSNSIYTQHLASEMMVKGLEVEQMFKNVRVKVLRDTQERQIPWVNTSLTVNFSFNPGPSPLTASAEDAARSEQRLRQLEAELEQTKRALDSARASARPSAAPPNAAAAPPNAVAAPPSNPNTERLEAELARARKAVEDARAESAAARAAAATPTRTGKAPERPLRAEAPPPTERRETTRDARARCAEILQRASLGEAITADDESFLTRECK